MWIFKTTKINGEHKEFKISGNRGEDTKSVIENMDVIKDRLPSSKYVSNSGHLDDLRNTYRRL